jgi:nitroreductase
MGMFGDLVRRNRSYRRFDETQDISYGELEQMIEAARLSPSAANKQPLKYILCNQRNLNPQVFSTLAWAGYLKDWPGPAEGERPTAYIVILGDREISTSFGCDHGIAAQSILLQAVELGYGGCIIGSVDRKTLKDILQIPDQYEVLLVIALGKPIEQVTLTTTQGDIKYWRDSHQIHYVPKRPLQEIIIKRLVEADL